MLGAADDRYKDLIMFVNTQFEQGNEAFNHLRDNFKHTCTQLNQNTNHIAKSHTEIHQALMVIADKFTAMANEVKVNRG
jgi:methyl-accepting chemotaxis protein